MGAHRMDKIGVQFGTHANLVNLLTVDLRSAIENTLAVYSFRVIAGTKQWRGSRVAQVAWLTSTIPST